MVGVSVMVAVAVGAAVGAGVQAARAAMIKMKDKMRIVVFMVASRGLCEIRSGVEFPPVKIIYQIWRDRRP